MRQHATRLLTGAAILVLAGCRPVAESPSASPLAVVLAPHAGDTSLDADIRRVQETLRTGSVNGIEQSDRRQAREDSGLERLGWLFVAKARVTFDPGFYKLAEQCALALDARAPGSHEALLLRGHVFQNLHRFREAEPIARTLAAARGLPPDLGLLGDVLMEQGKLGEAIDAYQRMADLRPDSQALVRIAHVRWLKGDLEGALQAARDAARATHPRDGETAAWIHTRLAQYEFQAGRTAAARSTCAAALALQSNYPPALLLRGRMALANDAPAVESLRIAAALNPVPEYQWALAESLRAARRADEAAAIEQQILKTGATEDPRTFSLFLATRRLQPDVARRLAEAELAQRADVHTHDALAWALAAANRWEDAAVQSTLALAEGTADARFFLHAAVISAHCKRAIEAREFVAKAAPFRQMLLPSELEQLRDVEQSTALAGHK